MTQSRFSPKEITPVSMMEKSLHIESLINQAKEKKAPLIEKKQEIEAALAELKNKIRMSGKMSDGEYRKACNKQNGLNSDKLIVEKALASIKQELQKLYTQQDTADFEYKRTSEEAKAFMYELRDKYLSFAADTTRVSSMRAMSSRFVEEIQIAIAKML